uniref:Uncharacterized protein n=1 Tax=Anguilla anguilla TaxID=7936 RepID=A0A0E9X1Q7_ANGAN
MPFAESCGIKDCLKRVRIKTMATTLIGLNEGVALFTFCLNKKRQKIIKIHYSK